MKNFKLTLAALLVSAATTATAGMGIENEMGSINFSGDVEFDIDYRNTDATSKDLEIQQGGRVLLQFDAMRTTASGYQAEVKVQPLVFMDGMGVDDAYFAFGKTDNWNLKIGRFEAYDMFPNGQDTFLNHAGDSNNENYTSSGPYMYHMKEARGRHTDGQIQYSQNFGNLYLEVATLLGDRSNFFDLDGADSQTKDSLMVRPVLAYSVGDFTISGSIETDLTGEAMIGGELVDMSDRIGYGMTGNYTRGSNSLNLSAAFMDGYNEENLSLGANVNLSGLGIGYYYTENSYEDGNFADAQVGDLTMHTVYASYEFTDVLNLDGFNIYPGAYYSNITDGADLFDGAEDDYGFRVRLKYFF
jgi:hypothetical protein